jgi:hypothetical protein
MRGNNLELAFGSKQLFPIRNRMDKDTSLTLFRTFNDATMDSGNFDDNGKLGSLVVGQILKISHCVFVILEDPLSGICHAGVDGKVKLADCWFSGAAPDSSDSIIVVHENCRTDTVTATHAVMAAKTGDCPANQPATSSAGFDGSAGCVRSGDFRLPRPMQGSAPNAAGVQAQTAGLAKCAVTRRRGNPFCRHESGGRISRGRTDDHVPTASDRFRFPFLPSARQRSEIDFIEDDWPCRQLRGRRC